MNCCCVLLGKWCVEKELLLPRISIFNFGLNNIVTCFSSNGIFQVDLMKVSRVHVHMVSDDRQDLEGVFPKSICWVLVDADVKASLVLSYISHRAAQHLNIHNRGGFLQTPGRSSWILAESNYWSNVFNGAFPLPPSWLRSTRVFKLFPLVPPDTILEPSLPRFQVSRVKPEFICVRFQWRVEYRNTGHKDFFGSIFLMHYHYHYATHIKAILA